MFTYSLINWISYVHLTRISLHFPCKKYVSALAPYKYMKFFHTSVQSPPFGLLQILQRSLSGDKHKAPLCRIRAQWGLNMKKIAIYVIRASSEGFRHTPAVPLRARQSPWTRGVKGFCGKIHWSGPGNRRTATNPRVARFLPAMYAGAGLAGIAAARRCIWLRCGAAEYRDR